MRKFVTLLNNIFIDIVLAIFYFTVFGIARLIFMISSATKNHGWVVNTKSKLSKNYFLSQY